MLTETWMRVWADILRTAGLLIRHDLRASFRGVFFHFPTRMLSSLFIFEGGAFVLLHGLAFPLAWRLQEQESSGFHLFTTIASSMSLILPEFFLLAMMSTIGHLYSRRDIDLVLAAPVSPRVVLGARCLAVAAESALAMLVFAGPPIDMIAWGIGVRWLALYPVLIAAALLAAAVSGAIALFLFWAIGPRKARTLVLSAGAIVSVLSAFSTMLSGVLPFFIQRLMFSTLNPVHGGSFDPRAWYWMPVRAGSGDVADLAIWCAFCVATFAGAVAYLGPSFVSFVARAAGMPAVSPGPAMRARPIRFMSSQAQILRWKEWRLLWRSPLLVPTISRHILSVVPAALIIWLNLRRRFLLPGRVFAATAIALAHRFHVSADSSFYVFAGPTLVIIASKLSGSFTRMILWCERAPDLLRSAPITKSALHLRRLQAIAPPLALLLVFPLFGLALLELRAAVWTMLFVLCSVTSAAFYNLWRPLADLGRNAALQRIRWTLIGRRERIMAFAWAGALALALLGSPLALAPIAAPLGMLYANRPARLRFRRGSGWRGVALT